MAKNISKSVIEDIAYELKNSGLWIISSENDKELGILDDEDDEDYTDPHKILSATANSIKEVLQLHDPTFDEIKWNKQVSYRIEQ